MNFAMRTCTTTALMQVSFLGLQPASRTPCSSQHTSPWRRIPYKLIHALQLLWSLLRAYPKAIYLLLSMYSGFLESCIWTYTASFYHSPLSTGSCEVTILHSTGEKTHLVISFRFSSWNKQMKLFPENTLDLQR